MLANVNKNLKSNNIAKMYGISGSYEEKDATLNVPIIMEKFDYNLLSYAIAY